MEKYFQLHGKTAEGRPLIHVVEPGTGYGLGESAGLEKVASGEHMPEVMELVHSIKAEPGRLYLVNSALGAGEWVGFNLRGDWFTERGLLHEPRGWRDIPVWDIDARRRAAATTEHAPPHGELAWGYPTFYNASRYQHHANKEPDKARGFILGAFYDHRMHRVVLVSELIRARCEQHGGVDVYDRIARGEFCDTSMGAKVPDDRCSICNNRARTPALYCQHVHASALPPYGMRAILPDGRMCGVYNDYPRFFDDSFVFIGAERSAKVMANVTARVRGNRAYGSQLYQPGARELLSRELVADVPATPRAEQEARLGRALQDVGESRVQGPTEQRLGRAISNALSAVPTLDKAEERALQHAAEVERRRAALKDRTSTDAEYRFWEARARGGLHNDGVAPDQQDRALALLRAKLEVLGEEKLGSLAKWATMMKEIPVPSSTQSALVRDHASRLTHVLPRPLLDSTQCPDDLWGLLSCLSHLGIVLRPDEFQGPMCRALGHGRVADEADEAGHVFAPTPLDPQHEPRWVPGAARPGDISSLARLLGPALAGRSFAPRVVAIRIVAQGGGPAPIGGSTSRTPFPHPVLNRVSQLYNDYRTGLLTREPDWRYVPTPAEPATLAAPAKIGDAARAVSSLLLRLAYW